MIGRVEAVAKGGRGIVFPEGKPVFIDGVLKGELVEFTITRRKHSVSFGSLIDIIETSGERVNPPCPYYQVCGGCNFQHMSYREQTVVKQDILESNLKRIAKIDFLHPVEKLTSPPAMYRTRCKLKIRGGKAGFFKKESHEIVENTTCLLLPQIVQDFLPELRRSPIIRNTAAGEILILSNGSEIAALLKAEQTRVYLGDREHISFNVGGFVFRFSPENFIQANRYTLEPMIALVNGSPGKDHAEHVVDLFCGTGFFTLPLSRIAAGVTALELDRFNINSLKINLRNNKINNVRIRRIDILRSVVPAADIYLADPPRYGLNKKVIDSITAHKPKKIIYFSCDSATFSRDVFYFCAAGYTVKELKIIDNFPHTDHFEIYACLAK